MRLQPLYGTSFLKALCKTLREGFSSEEVNTIYANKVNQNFVRPSIMVQHLPELTTPEMNNKARKRISFDIVCFAAKGMPEDEFQVWSLNMEYRIEELLHWLTVEGVPHRFRNIQSHIEQDLHMRLHVTVEYSLLVEYVNNSLDEELMLNLDKEIHVYVERQQD